jgi:ubiquinone/menaquinone biosynthesis C-methylase UbiE
MSQQVTPPVDAWKATASGYADQITRLTTLYGNDLIVLLDPYIREATTILDIGCGTGAFAHAYIHHYPNGIPGQTLLSTDLSPGMLQQAEQTILAAIDQKSFATKLVFQQEDGSKLDGIADHSIDIVVSLFGVFLIPSQPETIQAIHRVLKPNVGFFANAAWTNNQSNHSLDESFGGNLPEVFQTAGKAMHSGAATVQVHHSNDSEPTPPPIPPIKQWIDADSILQKLSQKESPFTEIKIYRTLHSMVWSNFETLYSVIASNPHVANATDEQMSNMKRVLIEMSFLPGANGLYYNSEQSGESNCMANTEQQQLLLKQPFVMWTASNLSMARAVVGDASATIVSS